MRNKPTTEYNGLTIIVDKPSRFDKKHLLTGMTGQWLEEECLRPYSIASNQFVFTPRSLSGTDTRDLECTDALLPGTTHIALLGHKASQSYGRGQPPGYPVLVSNKYQAIGAFGPQDCNDHRSMEDDNEDDDETFDDHDTKDSYPTRRYNYRFWTYWFLHKLLNTQRTAEPSPVLRAYPSSSTIIAFLNNTRNQDLYLDIETSRYHRCLTCIGLSSTSLWPVIYTIPVYRYNGKLAYDDFHLIYKALSLAMHTNTVVAHNASFDLFVLAAFYKFPLPNKIYDTMVANHRLFPEIEKSLAHVIAQWTYQHYHKDVSTEVFNSSDEQKMWAYNGRDVYNLKLIKDAQLKFAASYPGSLPSINNGNSLVPAMLENSLTGLRVDQHKLVETEVKLVKAKTQYARVAKVLTNDPMFNPGSPQQCKKFFFDKLNYSPTARSETGAPKLGRKQLYQLQLKHNNPLIPVLLRYRKAAKDSSMLNSELYTTL